MSKLYSKRVLVYLISVATLLLLLPTQLILGQPPKTCGMETVWPVNGTFWSIGNGTQINVIAPVTGGKNQIKSTSVSVATDSQFSIRFPFDTITLVKGEALAILEVLSDSNRRDDFKKLSILTQKGQITSIVNAEKSKSMHFWRLLPEREDNHFGIFGYDDATNAFIVDVSWSSNGIILGEPQILPFKFYPMQFYWAMLSISPDWRYVSYIQDTNSAGLEAFIYSVAESRYVWQSAYDGDGFVNVIWTLKQPLALVSGLTAETANQLISIGTDGKASLLTDLSATYGEKASLLGLSGIAVAPNQVVFMVNLQAAEHVNRLVRMDLDTQQLTDLCYSSSSDLSIIDVAGSDLILKDTTTRRLVAISTQTGDYSYIDLTNSINPLPNTFEING